MVRCNNPRLTAPLRVPTVPAAGVHLDQAGACGAVLMRLAMLLLVVWVAACAGASTAACRVDADCASGTCRAGGTCADEPDGGAAQTDGGGAADGGGEHPPDAGPSHSCLPNHDGRLDRAELPLKEGLVATFRVATDTDVGSAGTGGPTSYAWDLSGTLAHDTDTRVALLPVAGQWWASSFPSASYATPLAAGSALLGVFELNDTELKLLGVVSPVKDGLYTNLAYNPAVKVLAFPVAKGGHWTTRTVVSGLASGFAAYYTEDYDSTADREGTLRTPYGTFPVLRVRTLLTRTLGYIPTRVLSFAFLSECFGTVASMRSADNETKTELTHAVEVRRIAP